ncbi:MAG: tail fiber protein, partial [Deltaproteobacteria bacterium]|nr:tail fiber protein [Deltaproteobacteria bacterium]
SISQNQALYTLLGTTFGGNGTTTFALPDMRSRAPIHVAPGYYALGSKGGEEGHVLTTAEIPLHTHNLMVDAREGATTAPA